MHTSLGPLTKEGRPRCLRSGVEALAGPVSRREQGALGAPGGVQLVLRLRKGIQVFQYASGAFWIRVMAEAAPQ